MSRALLDAYFLKIETKLTDETDPWEAGRDLAKLMSLRDSHVRIPQIRAIDGVPRNWLRRHMDAPFDLLVFLHMKCASALANGKYVEAYREQVQLLQTFTKEVIQKRKDENWFFPICYTVCSELRLCAKAADQHSASSHFSDEQEQTDDEFNVSSFYEKAATPIMECYRSCVSDVRASFEISKRIAMLNLTNQLFRIYFKINKLNLLKPLVRAIDNCDPALYEQFSLADKVTYKYYTGRRAMFDSEFKAAEDALSFAFRNCYPDSRRNKRLILIYLIPVKMFLGHLPSEALLLEHDLYQYSDVVLAVRQGNLRLFDDALAKYDEFFIKSGIFLIMEKLKMIAYRRLFKKVWIITGTHQVPLEAFVVALKNVQGINDIDQDEVACILANLIYQGKIKGYISHQHQKLVVSKKDPFPKLSTVATA